MDGVEEKQENGHRFAETEGKTDRGRDTLEEGLKSSKLLAL